MTLTCIAHCMHWGMSWLPPNRPGCGILLTSVPETHSVIWRWNMVRQMTYRSKNLSIRTRCLLMLTNKYQQYVSNKKSANARYKEKIWLGQNCSLQMGLQIQGLIIDNCLRDDAYLKSQSSVKIQTRIVIYLECDKSLHIFTVI